VCARIDHARRRRPRPSSIARDCSSVSSMLITAPWQKNATLILQNSVTRNQDARARPRVPRNGVSRSAFPNGVWERTPRNSVSCPKFKRALSDCDLIG
jgi:hypothetical protein